MLGPEDDLRTTAWYRVESHDATLPVALPTGAEWVRARIGGEAVGQVEPIPKAGGYRLRFPKRAAPGPCWWSWSTMSPPVSRRPGTRPSCSTAARSSRPSGRCACRGAAPWSAPRRAGSTRTDGTGTVTPGCAARARGRRRWPAWVNGTAAPARDATDGEDGGGAYHAYLFGRPGPPAGLRPVIASRAWLVALCSGPVLGLGVLVLHRRRPPRLIWAAALALALAAAVVVQPAATILAVQSSLIGVVFTLVAALVQRLVERPRRSAAAVFRDPGGLATPAASGSSLGRMTGVGSDDSTAIRVRAVSTVDHVATAAPPAPEEAVGRGPGAERD